MRKAAALTVAASMVVSRFITDLSRLGRRLWLVLVAPDRSRSHFENSSSRTLVVTGDNIVSGLTGIIGKALNTSVG
ncbi:hypothetical protein [Gordonia sp. (in: high G+C Gram-positive bacteria)]|uniref:hypothetical protein n=1 Tax=Gordonia sp. (in: high G+C Gram-positive bacteria) TaxID=84139 RepID=UPI00257B8655|nr:hypothetical protein [Gordonia sp. (in: high G+C Gram-positive bacteria)]